MLSKLNNKRRASGAVTQEAEANRSKLIKLSEYYKKIRESFQFLDVQYDLFPNAMLLQKLFRFIMHVMYLG